MFVIGKITNKNYESTNEKTNERDQTNKTWIIKYY